MKTNVLSAAVSAPVHSSQSAQPQIGAITVSNTVDGSSATSLDAVLEQLTISHCATAPVAALLSKDPTRWGLDDLRAAGVAQRTAQVLLSAMAASDGISMQTVARAVVETSSTADVLVAIRRATTANMTAAETMTDTPVVLRLLALALRGESLDSLADAAGGKPFVSAVIDLFMGHYHAIPDAGTRDAVAAIDIVLACGASLDATAFGGIPPLPYALCRVVPDAVVDRLLRYGANPNEAVSGAHRYSAACGLDYLPGGTAMHHAVLAGRGTTMSMLARHGGRLDVQSFDGYDALAVAGAAASSLASPRAGLIEMACVAADRWVLQGGDARVQGDGEFMVQVLATRLLEFEGSASAHELRLWRQTIDALRERGCNVTQALGQRPIEGGATYAQRIAGLLADVQHSVAGMPAYLVRASERPALWREIQNMIAALPAGDVQGAAQAHTTEPARVVKRATTAPLYGDAVTGEAAYFPGTGPLSSAHHTFRTQ